jgi:hypothetical protein
MKFPDYVKVLIGAPVVVGFVWGFAVFVMIGG